jgi:hypothetical protein
MSEAAVSLARIIMAAEDLFSVVVCPGGCRILISSTAKTEGIKALMTDGDVPGGSDARYKVGLAAALSASSIVLSASGAPNDGVGPEDIFALSNLG